jgi:hypothetical protein
MHPAWSAEKALNDGHEEVATPMLCAIESFSPELIFGLIYGAREVPGGRRPLVR